LFAWAVKGELTDAAKADPALALIAAMDELKRLDDVKRGGKRMRRARLPRECVPTQWLTFPEVWEALLEDMPLTALIRNLATMTRVGLLTPGAKATHAVAGKLADRTRLA